MRNARLFLLLFTAGSLITLNLSEAKKPANPGVDKGLVNPAYVIMDGENISRLKLLSFDGLEEQEIVKARAFQGMKAPTFSPDGQWISYKKGEDDGRSLRMIHPDGSGERTIYYENGPLLEPIHGMQWVPGEVDRIIYCTAIDSSVYSISTLDPSPTPRLILLNPYWLGGASLSPDLAPTVDGYQGAMVFVGPRDLVFGQPPLLSVVFVEDREQGLEVDLSSLVQATTLSDGAATPSWSHDGLEIAFLYHNKTYPAAGNSLEVIPVNVGETGITLFEENVRTIYDSSLVQDYGDTHSVVHRPSWSPDNSLIGFCATVGIEPGGGRSYDLFIAASDGSDSVNVTLGSRRPTYMDWNPGFDISKE